MDGIKWLQYGIYFVQWHSYLHGLSLNLGKSSVMPKLMFDYDVKNRILDLDFLLMPRLEQFDSANCRQMPGRLAGSVINLESTCD